jgi:hypothetical protein
MPACSYVTTLSGRRVRSANLPPSTCKRSRITPSMAARIGRDLIRAQASHSVADIIRTAASLAVQVRSAAARPPPQLAAVTREGELLLLVSALQASQLQPGKVARALPDVHTIAQVQQAVTQGVQLQLRLDVPITAEMVWGPSCDPVFCIGALQLGGSSNS